MIHRAPPVVAGSDGLWPRFNQDDDRLRQNRVVLHRFHHLRARGLKAAQKLVHIRHVEHDADLRSILRVHEGTAHSDKLPFTFVDFSWRTGAPA